MVEKTEQKPPAYEQFDPQFGKRRGDVAHLHGLFDKLLPRDVADPENSLETASEYLEEGRGLIVIMNHPSAGDHLRMIKTVFANDNIRNSPISIAIAHHQYPWHVARLMEFTGVDSQGVVTTSTVEKGKNRLHPTQKLALLMKYVNAHLSQNEAEAAPRTLKEVWDEWQKPLGAGHGSTGYLKKARATLSAGGVVVLGPQGTRDKELRMWDNRPIQMLLGRDKEKHIGFLFLGIDERDGKKGMNPFQTYGIQVGKAITYEDLEAFAAENGLSLDEAVFEILSDVVKDAKAASKEVPLQEGIFTKIKSRVTSWISQRSSDLPEHG